MSSSRLRVIRKKLDNIKRYYHSRCCQKHGVIYLFSCYKVFRGNKSLFGTNNPTATKSEYGTI